MYCFAFLDRVSVALVNCVLFCVGQRACQSYAPPLYWKVSVSLFNHVLFVLLARQSECVINQSCTVSLCWTLSMSLVNHEQFFCIAQ